MPPSWHATGRVSEDARSIDGVRGRRRPAGGQARRQELIGVGAVVPHGDRFEGAQSGRVEDEGTPAAPGEDDVVGIFVLHHDLLERERRPRRERPAQQLLQGHERGELTRQRVELVGRERGAIVDANTSV